MLQMMFLHRLCYFLRAEFLVCCACRSSNSRFGNKKKLAVSTGTGQTLAKGHHSAIAWSENTRVSPCLNTSASVGVEGSGETENVCCCAAVVNTLASVKWQKATAVIATAVMASD